MHPLPEATNTGVPPTPLNARTGELTPPGITRWASSNADCDRAMLREPACGMNEMIGERDGATKHPDARRHLSLKVTPSCSHCSTSRRNVAIVTLSCRDVSYRFS